MSSYGDDIELEEDDPSPDLIGKPCAYCGQPSEGFNSVHRDGFDEGPEVPLCIACGAYESPDLNEIWAKISQVNRDKPEEFQPSLLDGELSEEKLAEIFGCDACGVRDTTGGKITTSMKLFGGDHPGVWKFEDIALCSICKQQRDARTVCVDVFKSVDTNYPVKGRIWKQALDGSEEAVWSIFYDGIDDWMARNSKRKVVKSRQRRTTITRADLRKLRSKMVQARQSLGLAEDVEE